MGKKRPVIRLERTTPGILPSRQDVWLIVGVVIIVYGIAAIGYTLGQLIGKALGQ